MRLTSDLTLVILRFESLPGDGIIPMINIAPNIIWTNPIIGRRRAVTIG